MIANNNDRIENVADDMAAFPAGCVLQQLHIGEGFVFLTKYGVVDRS